MSKKSQQMRLERGRGGLMGQDRNLECKYRHNKKPLESFKKGGVARSDSSYLKITLIKYGNQTFGGRMKAESPVQRAKLNLHKVCMLKPQPIVPQNVFGNKVFTEVIESK